MGRFAIPYAQGSTVAAGADDVSDEGFTLLALTPAQDCRTPPPCRIWMRRARGAGAAARRGGPGSVHGCARRHAREGRDPDAARRGFAQRRRRLGRRLLGAERTTIGDRPMADLFPSVRRCSRSTRSVGMPRVVAGADRARPARRWVHAAEVPDIATHATRRETRVMTGHRIAERRRTGSESSSPRWPCRPRPRLVVELGRRYRDAIPNIMSAAPNKRGLPLVERAGQRRRTITEAVARVDRRRGRGPSSGPGDPPAVHELSARAPTRPRWSSRTVRSPARRSRVEKLSRQVLEYDSAGERPEACSWTAGRRTSRRVHVDGRNGSKPTRALAGHHGRARVKDWGRLLLRPPERREIRRRPA